MSTEDLCPAPFRIGVLSAFFGMYDDFMGSGFRAEQEAAAAANIALLRGDFEVLDLGLVSSLAAAEAASQALSAVSVDAMVVAPTMVAPPQWLEIALSAVRCPLVIWSATRFRRFSAHLNHREATVHTSLVGATMMANCLVRRGVAFKVVDAAPDSPDEMQRLIRILRAASVASRLSSATALRVGEPIPGYTDVESSHSEMSAIGVREVAVKPDEFAARFRAISEQDARLLLTDLGARSGWVLPAQAPEAVDSARIAMALRALSAEHRATFGTVNCHGPCLRDHAEVGMVACLGVSLMHAAGVPFSCTGDMPAAIASMLAKLLSGRSLYCELYAREPDSGEFLIASGGEGDPAWADASGVTVVPCDYYTGKRGSGLALRFALQPGPATVIALTPGRHCWRLIWATGTVTTRSFANFDGPNGIFRFDSGPSNVAAERWIAAGPTHHAALAAGDLSLELEVISDLAGFESHQV